MRALRPGAAALGLLAALATGVVLHNVLAVLTLVVVQELLDAPPDVAGVALGLELCGAAFGTAAVGTRVALARGAGDRTALAVGCGRRGCLGDEEIPARAVASWRSSRGSRRCGHGGHRSPVALEHIELYLPPPHRRPTRVGRTGALGEPRCAHLRLSSALRGSDTCPSAGGYARDVADLKGAAAWATAATDAKS